MKKLSIISLIISIVALLIAVWVWTDGFGGGSTYAFRTVQGTTGGGKGGGTGSQNLTTTTQVITDNTKFTAELISLPGKSIKMKVYQEAQYPIELSDLSLVVTSPASDGLQKVIGIKVGKVIISDATVSSQLTAELPTLTVTDAASVKQFTAKAEANMAANIDLADLEQQLRAIVAEEQVRSIRITMPSESLRRSLLLVTSAAVTGASSTTEANLVRFLLEYGVGGCATGDSGCGSGNTGGES